MDTQIRPPGSLPTPRGAWRAFRNVEDISRPHAHRLGAIPPIGHPGASSLAAGDPVGSRPSATSASAAGPGTSALPPSAPHAWLQPCGHRCSVGLGQRGPIASQPDAKGCHAPGFDGLLTAEVHMIGGAPMAGADDAAVPSAPFPPGRRRPLATRQGCPYGPPYVQYPAGRSGDPSVERT